MSSSSTHFLDYKSSDELEAVRSNVSAAESTTPRVRRFTIHASSTNSLTTFKPETGIKIGKKHKDHIKCFKHSPRVIPVKTRSCALERYETGAKAWRQAFDAMGGLYRSGLKEVTPVCKLDPQPHHCASIGRTFTVAYGKLSQVEGASAKGVNKRKKEVPASVCACIESERLPLLYKHPLPYEFPKNFLNYDGRQMVKYWPKSSVVVRWDPTLYSAEDICQWLPTFGTFLFTVRKGINSMIVAFDKISAAIKAVNNCLVYSRVSIVWLDKKFYNYGHMKEYENYTINDDALWREAMQQMKGNLKGAPPMGPRKG